MSATAVVTNSLIGVFDPNIIDGGPGTVLREANNNDQEALNRLGSGSAAFPTFKVMADTNTDDTLSVVNLTTLGVTFPLAQGRMITVRAWARTVAGTNCAYSEGRFLVLGNTATTPNVQPAGTSAVPADDQRYVTRTPLTTTATTPVYVSALPVVSANNAVIVRITGPTAGVDLRWLVEVDVGALKLLPVALT